MWLYGERGQSNINFIMTLPEREEQQASSTPASSEVAHDSAAPVAIDAA